MRRLPIYFVLDVSESMVGENLQKLEEGVSSIVRSLRQDPHALETIYISIIAFAGKSRTIVPLIELASFYPPKLPIGGGTSLGGALFHLMSEIDKSVIKTTAEVKGDWKPIVYLLTDGKPTDLVSSAVTKWKNEYVNKATLIAIAIGNFADSGVLKQLTEHAFMLENTNNENFTKFIKWITASVASQSKSISDAPTTNVNLVKLDKTILSPIKDAKDLRIIDPDYVILVGKCQRTRRPYLMKYERNRQQIQLQDFTLDSTLHLLSGCYPVGEDYFEWSDGENSKLNVNTGELLGTPSCPHCGNSSAFGVCSCGGIMCLNEPGVATCPWCNKEVVFSAGKSGEENFNVNRVRG